MKTHYLKITALTPLHIGTGEDYEPTNFVVEEGKLYEFDEFAFFERLDPTQRSAFQQIVSQRGPEMLFKVHAFTKRYKDIAIEVAHNVVDVTRGIADDYASKIGRAVQFEGKGKRGDVRKVFNNFQIARSQRLLNFQELYIPGSSFKGALSTGWQEWLFRHDRRRWENEFERLRNPTYSPMKNLLVADLLPLKWRGEIGYALNKERFENDDQGPTTKLEVIREGSLFVTTLGFKALDPKLNENLERFVTAANEHYRPLLEELIEKRDHIGSYVGTDTIERLKRALSQTDNKRFLLRVGKHSGARAVTIDGNREIRVKVSGGGPKRKPNEWKKLEEETTTWLYGESEHQNHELLPFGWVLCEAIEEEEYRTLLAEREERIAEWMARKSAEAETKRQAEEERRALEERRAREREEEERRKREEAEAEAARLASLSPVDRLLEEHDIPTLVRMMQNGEIENFDSIKVELARKIKEELMKYPKTWEKAKQKALKRKEFIQQILGEK